MSEEQRSSGKARVSKPSDLAWEHGQSIPGNPHGVVCNYCGQSINSGGITRLKQHLGWVGSNVKKCPKVPKSLRMEMKESLLSKAAGKKIQKERLKEMTAELYGQSLEMDSDSDGDDEAGHMRRAMRESRAMAWEREERDQWEEMRERTLHGSRSVRETGGPSRLREETSQGKKKKGGRGPIEKMFARSASMRGGPHKLYESAGGVQKKMTHMFQKGKDKVKQLGESVSQFFIHGGIPAHLAQSVAFKNMIHTAEQVGPGVDPPSPYQIMNTYLDAEVQRTRDWVTEQTIGWKTYGVSLMCDGWTGPTKLSIINMMTYSRGVSIFWKSIDASAHIKDANYIYRALQHMIRMHTEDVHVIQIITDNGAAFKKAGKMLEREYPLYWTPCAAHCIDLMLEDIGRRPSIQTVIYDARRVTKFIYNHSWVKRMFHDESGYRNEIVRPGKTRFATNFISLNSMWKARQGLTTAFNSDAWNGSRYAVLEEGLEVWRIIFNTSFWDKVRNALSILEPIYQVLRIVDSETYPSMGSLYEAFLFMKERLEKVRGGGWVLQIVDFRWKNMLRHPLHQAAYFLNPKYHYERRLGDNMELNRAVLDVFEKLFPSSPYTGTFTNELMAFREARGLFGRPSAVDSRASCLPCEWWNLYGMETPALRQLAVRILSQTVSSSPCERNWSTFSLIHTQKRNRLGYQRLQDLVFCHYNMRLRERLLRDENKEPEDPLDLTTIGQYAYVEGNEDREDPLYEWVKNVSVDEGDGMPAQMVADEARAQGVDVEEVVHKQSTPEESFDPLSRSQIGRSLQPSSSLRQTYGSSPASSSKTDTDETRDDDDDGGQGGPGGGVYEGYGTGSQQPLSPFTFEAQYTHATQDYDHGARSQSQPYTKRQKEKEPLDEASLSQSFAGFDLDISGTMPHPFYYPQSEYPYAFMCYNSMPPDNEEQQNIADEDYEEPARHSTWY